MPEADGRCATLRIVDRQIAFLISLALLTCAHAQERPLLSLPYTPSLEPAFLDQAVDPCEDFFHYACGNWIRMIPIPADQPRWDVYGKLQVDNQRFLWAILEAASKPAAGRSANEQKIGDYFGACVDETAVETAGMGPLRQRLDEIAALKHLADLPPLLGSLHLRTVDTSPLFGFGSSQDFEDSKRVIAFASAGNLRDWWTKKNAGEFVKRASCISDQYSQYTVVDDIKINGKLTLGEDTADLGGTILAYMAWKDATRGKDLQPIGGFTPERRFFIGMAQWARGDERAENKRVNAVTNPHSPNEYRISGVVSNMPEFAKAFSCRAGQKMVREQLCRVW